jgi:lipoprotein NlpD
MYFKQIFIVVLCVVISACASPQNRAPVLDRSGAYNAKKPATKLTNKDWRPDFHIVKKGDTLYSIGLEYGYDYREIAQLNQIEQPFVIRLGQTLKLKEAKTQTKTVVTQKPHDDDVVIKPLNNNSSAPLATPASTVTDNTDQKNNNRSSNIQNIAFGQQEENTEWIWPTKGKVTNGFIEGGNTKGIDIEGKLGQEINAASAGKVIYNGSDLRGYGNLVIIKHNTDYLSVYAHNNKILVKEGQQVLKGQKIAEMGNSGADKVKLHFEIRYQGKSVDPNKFLGNLMP